MLITINERNYAAANFITTTPGAGEAYNKLAADPTYGRYSSGHLNWVLMYEHFLLNQPSDKFTMKDIFLVNFELVKEETLTAIIHELVKKGKYKKYNNVWVWVPPLQERLLSTDWDKLKKQKAKKASLEEEPQRRATLRRPSRIPSPTIVDVGTIQTYRDALLRGRVTTTMAQGSISRSNWSTSTVSDTWVGALDPDTTDAGMLPPISMNEPEAHHIPTPPFPMPTMTDAEIRSLEADMDRFINDEQQAPESPF